MFGLKCLDCWEVLLSRHLRFQALGRAEPGFKFTFYVTCLKEVLSSPFSGAESPQGTHTTLENFATIFYGWVESRCVF